MFWDASMLIWHKCIYHQYRASLALLCYKDLSWELCRQGLYISNILVRIKSRDFIFIPMEANKLVHWESHLTRWGQDKWPPFSRRHFFLNENVQIFIKISLNFVPKGPIKNIPALIQIIAWRRPGDKPLSESMMGSLLTRICVTRPQWVNCVHWNGKIIIVTVLFMMTSSNGNTFHVTGHLCRKFTGHRWIPLTKASDVELWCFLWFAPE